MSRVRESDAVQQSVATLGSGNLRDAVRLPEGEDINEWLAVNVMDVFNQLRMLYGVVLEECTPERCPTMSGGPRHEYAWTRDGKQLPVPASLYVDYAMTWIQQQVDDEEAFPSQLGKRFPATFRCTVEKIVSRMFRIYAHIFHAHSKLCADLKATAHLNTSFKHFILFAQQFGLISQQEMQPLDKLIEALGAK